MRWKISTLNLKTLQRKVTVCRCNDTLVNVIIGERTEQVVQIVKLHGMTLKADFWRANKCQSLR